MYLKLLAKIVLIPLRLTAAATATDAVIQTKIFLDQAWLHWWSQIKNWTTSQE